MKVKNLENHAQQLSDKELRAAYVELMQAVEFQGAVLGRLLKGVGPDEGFTQQTMVIMGDKYRIFAIAGDGSQVAWADFTMEEEDKAEWHIIDIGVNIESE